MSSVLLATVVVVLIFLLLFAATNVGSERYVTPSSSVLSSKYRRMLVSEGEIKDILMYGSWNSIQINECWIENVLKRHDSLPFLKTVSGKRVCISGELTKDNQDAGLPKVYLNICGMKLDTGRLQGTFSSNRIVLVRDIPVGHSTKDEFNLVIQTVNGDVVSRITVQFD